MEQEAKIVSVHGSVLCLRDNQRERVYCLDGALYFSMIEGDNLSKSVALTKGGNTTLPHRYSHAVSVSSNGFICVPLLDVHSAIIVSYETQTQKISNVSSINEHDGDVECSAFSSDNKLFVTGGQDGRVYFYEIPTFRVLGSLLPRADYISSIIFSQSGEKLVVCGFDKFVMVFDILRHKIETNFATPDVVEDAVFFDNEMKLFLVARNGSSLVYSFYDGKIISQEHPFAFWPTCVAVDPKEHYGIVGTRSCSVYVMNLQENTRILEIKTDHPGIASVTFAGDILYLGSIDGSVQIIEYNKGKEVLEESIAQKDYKRAREAINENVFLTIHPLNKAFDEAWEGILSQAILLIKDNKIDEALAMTAPFTVDEKKQRELNVYLMQKGNVTTFAQLIEEKNYQKAYEMTITTKFLTQIPLYEELENRWNSAFFNAKKLLIEDAKLNQKKATEILKPFENTPKKELISQLLRNSGTFAKAEQTIKDKDFKGYFTLCFQFSFLRDTDLYKKVLALGEKMLSNLTELEAKGDFEEAKKVGEVLINFNPFKRAANQKLVLIAQKEGLLEAIKTHNIKLVYDLVSNNEALRGMEEFRTFSKEFLNLYDIAKTHAYEGHAQSVRAVFGEYMDIGYWIDKIASVFKIAYLAQIDFVINEENVNWAMTLKRFCDRYGKCGEIQRLVEKNPQAKEVLDSFEENNGDGYLHQKFIDDIVVYATEKT